MRIYVTMDEWIIASQFMDELISYIYVYCSIRRHMCMYFNVKDNQDIQGVSKLHVKPKRVGTIGLNCPEISWTKIISCCLEIMSFDKCNLKLWRNYDIFLLLYLIFINFVHVRFETVIVNNIRKTAVKNNIIAQSLQEISLFV